jgi:serine/threonine protein phosphatase PrpC
VDEIARIEAEVAELVSQGKAAPLTRPGGARVASSSGRAVGSTRPRGEAGCEASLNTDNVLVTATTVANDEALILAIAHGNYKDLGCAFASGVAVWELHRELTKPLLGLADVPPVLRRAMLNTNARIFSLADTGVGGRRVGTVVGTRKDLRGIGASVLAAVVTRSEIVIAHIGENRALLVRDGQARDLVVPHTLWWAQGHGRRARMNAEEAASAEDIVLRGVGLTEKISIDVVRSPRSPGDRFVIGNGGLRMVLRDPAPTWGGDTEALVDELVRGIEARAAWVPPSVIVADLAKD